MVVIFDRPLSFFLQLKPPNSKFSKLHTVNSSCRQVYVRNKFDFSSENTNTYKRRRSIPIIDSITAHVSRDRCVEESIEALEQEDCNGELAQFHLNPLQPTLDHLSKWLPVTLFSLVLLWRHDAKSIWIAMGSVLNVGLSITIKKILNQERPSSASKSDPGMPSSHAQSIFFIVFNVILSTMDWFGMNIYTTPLAGLVLAFGSYFAWLRVSEGFHTISQVVVGAVAGSLYARLWFWLWDAIVLQAFISSIWIRLLVVVGGVGCVLRFALFLLRHWIVNAP